jgi:imidazolonepropionase-like amidohydrolase
VRATRVLCVLLVIAGCGEAAPGPDAVPTQAFVGATIFDGTGSSPVPDAVLLVRDGRVEAVGPRATTEIPEAAQVIDLTGRYVIPGLINAHGHVGGTRGLESGPEHFDRENIQDQLALYARYGVTTVVSLGGDGETDIAIRLEQAGAVPDRARLYVAGPVLAPTTPDEAREQVRSAAASGVDWIKIRVDDNLGQGSKMPEPVYRAVIEEATAHGLPVAAHVVYLEDAHGLVRAGVKLLAHSVRDRAVDEELIRAMRERDVCLSPTLTREISTFVYRERPAFFDDPFFLAEADTAVMRGLEDPDRQRRVGEDRGGQFWEAALPIAERNLNILADAGVGIAFGTDSGPVARFQGYFEHLEMWMMADAGLSPAAVLRSATADAARCMGLDAELGTLTPEKWADFIVLERDPIADIRNTRTLESVWIAGTRVAPRPGAT